MGGKHDVCIAVILSEAKNLIIFFRKRQANMMFASILFPQTEISPFEDVQETLNVF